MSYKSILVNLDIDGPVAPLVKLGIDLAARFDAKLIGFCAADAPMPTMMAPEGATIGIEILQQQRGDIGNRFKELRAEFDALAAQAGTSEWRESVNNPTRALVQQARIADLIVTGAPQGAATGDAYRVADPGSVVLHAGRPVLVAASGAEHVAANNAVIAWKDTREARRAVADAVPLLASANEVIVVTVDSDPDDWTHTSVADVTAYLGRHGIRARTEVIKAKDEGGKLLEFAASVHADLLVSGAYGHSRLREWVLGGVTRSLLDEILITRFMAG